MILNLWTTLVIKVSACAGIPKKKYIGKYIEDHEGELFDDGSIIFNRKPKDRKEGRGFKRTYRLQVLIRSLIPG